MSELRVLLLLTTGALLTASCAGQEAPAAATAPEVDAPRAEPTGALDAETAPFEPPADRIGLVAEVGRPLPGHPESSVTALGIPTTDSAGRLSFTGAIAGIEREDGFVWQDGRIRWRNSRAESASLRGAAPQVASSAPGVYVYRTQIDGAEGLWGHHGRILRKDDEAPGFGAGSKLLFFRRPTMLSSGKVFWVSEVRDGKGPRGKARVLFASATASAQDVDVVLRSDQQVGSFTLARPNGLELAYQIAPNGEHHAHVVNVFQPELRAQQGLLVDGELRLLQGAIATEAGERWERFFHVAIDDAGNYLVSADTDGSVDHDLVTVYNGQVVLREGESVGGFVLRPPAKALAVALDDAGHSTQLWSVGGVGEEIVLFSCDPSHPEQGSILFETRTRIDLDGDGAMDARIERLSDLGHGDLLGRRGGRHLYVGVQLERPGETMHEAILSVPIPECRPAEDGASTLSAESTDR